MRGTGINESPSTNKTFTKGISRFSRHSTKSVRRIQHWGEHVFPSKLICNASYINTILSHSSKHESLDLSPYEKETRCLRFPHSNPTEEEKRVSNGGKSTEAQVLTPQIGTCLLPCPKLETGLGAVFPITAPCLRADWEDREPHMLLMRPMVAVRPRPNQEGSLWISAPSATLTQYLFAQSQNWHLSQEGVGRTAPSEKPKKYLLFRPLSCSTAGRPREGDKSLFTRTVFRQSRRRRAWPLNPPFYLPVPSTFLFNYRCFQFRQI